MYANIDDELGHFDAIWKKAKKMVDDEHAKKPDVIFDVVITYDTPNGTHQQTFTQLNDMVLLNDHYTAFARANKNGGIVVNMDKIRYFEVFMSEGTEEDKNGDT